MVRKTKVADGLPSAASAKDEVPRPWRFQFRPRPVQRPNLSATLRKWHQRAGLFAFVFMGWLGISGILLNQSAAWGLDGNRIGWPWLMSVYSLHAQAPTNGFHAGSHWAALAGKTVVLDGKPLDSQIQQPIGLATGGEAATPLLFVAASDDLLILSAAGDRVDELQPPLTLPLKVIRRLGSLIGSPGTVVVEGDKRVQSVDGVNWADTPSAAQVSWSAPERLSVEQSKLAVTYSKPTVSLEQILIDTHSGRIFGRLGPYVIDAVGAAAAWLSVSGMWMTWRTSRGRRAARK